MSRPRLRNGVAGLITLLVFALVLLAWRPPAPDGAGAKGVDKPRKPRPEGKPVAMVTNLTGLRINLGLKDAEATTWDGEIQLSEGKLVSLTILQGGGAAKKKMDGKGK